MSHGTTLNKRLHQAGIVWHACPACGRDWPFPVGVPPEVDSRMHEQREWLCAVCLEALRAATARQVELMGLAAYRAARVFEPNMEAYHAAMTVYAAAFGPPDGEVTVILPNGETKHGWELK